MTLNHSRKPPRKPDRYKVVLLERLFRTMPIYLIGSEKMEAVWMDESDTLSKEGAMRSQPRRRIKVMAPVARIDKIFCF